MTVRVRDWLPQAAMDHDVVWQALETAIAQWDGQWFTTSYVEVAEMRSSATDSRLDDGGADWRTCRAAIAIRAGRGGLSRLVERALDLRADMPKPAEADRRLLDRFEERLLESLAEGLEAAFGVKDEPRADTYRPTDPFSGDDGLLVVLADSAGRDLLTVAVPGKVVFRHVKASLPRPQARTSSLRPLTEALADVDIPMRAQLGKVELSLAELNDLAVGDVLVLDRRLEQAVDIVGHGAHDVFAKAVLTPVESGFALLFQ